MTRNPNPADPQNLSLQQFLEIHKKMLKDSRSFAIKMADSLAREKIKSTDQTS